MYEVESITFSMIFVFILQLIFTFIVFVFFVVASIAIIDKIDEFTDKKEMRLHLTEFICHMIGRLVAWFVILIVFSYAILLLIN